MPKFIAKERTTVTAWKYEKGSDVPIWVARKCHDLGDGKFTANTLVGPLPINLGDYVVMVDDEQTAVAVVTGSDFESEYEPA